MKFCDDCKNLLNINTNNNVITFICKSCFKEFQSTDDDTLMLSVDLKESKTFYNYKTFIKLAGGDNLSPSVYKDCINKDCDEKIIKMITINEEMSIVYICPKCGETFTSNE